jgi:hypothetical protein
MRRTRPPRETGSRRWRLPTRTAHVPDDALALLLDIGDANDTGCPSAAALQNLVGAMPRRFDEP